jgi:hypothetical protein
MRKALPVILSVMVFAACGGDTVKDNVSPSEITAAIIEAGEFPEMTERGKDRLADYFFGIEMDGIEDAAYCISPSGVAPDIVAVIRTDTAATAGSLNEFFVRWTREQIDSRGDYHPGQAHKLANLIIRDDGNYVVLLVCEDSTAALRIFSDYIYGRRP